MDNGPELIAWALRDWCRLHRHDDELHRAGLAVGEPLRRELQRPDPRRAAQHRGVRQPARGPGRHRSLARRVQHLPTPQLPRRPHPRRVRRAVDHQPTSAPMTAGPLNGAPSVGRRPRSTRCKTDRADEQLATSNVIAAVTSVRDRQRALIGIDDEDRQHAGWSVALAFSLTQWCEPGSSKKPSPT